MIEVKPMFDQFRRRSGDPKTQRRMSRIRADTRALIRLANIAGAPPAGAGRPNEPAATLGERLQQMAFAEKRLERSISSVLSADLGIQSIVSDVIRPVLREVVVMSATAQEAVARAATAAARARSPGAVGQ